MIFLNKIHFTPKLLKYLIIHAVHSQELAEVYLSIPIFIFIDTYLRAKLKNFFIYREFLETLRIFGSELPDISQVTRII